MAGTAMCLWLAIDPEIRHKNSKEVSKMRLENKVAFVTGAGMGIGRAIALKLAQEGAKVVATDIAEETCRGVVGEIESAGGTGLALQCDVSNGAQIDNAIQKTVAEFGRLDILVNNAGITSFKPILELSEEEWDRTMNINLKGQFLCAQAAAKQMVKNEWGRIINIASISYGGCGIAFPQVAHYTASKGGVVALTQALAVELSSQGITCNVICPGIIDTEMTKSIREGDQLQQLLGRIPKGRTGRPEDIAHLVVYLASEQSDYMTGASLVVDGGWLTT